MENDNDKLAIPPENQAKQQPESQTKSQIELAKELLPETITIDITYRTDHLTFPGVEMNKPIKHPIQQLCAAFAHDLKYLKVRLEEKEMSYKDWTRFFPNLTV